MGDAARSMQGHRLPVRVYWEDTDGSGIVYHAAYVRFAERGRTELLRAAGFDQSRLLEETGIAFAVRHMAIDFRAPARLDDLLTVVTSVEDAARASLLLDQRIWRDDRLLTGITVKLACIDRRGRPVRIPGPVAAAFAQLAPTMTA